MRPYCMFLTILAAASPAFGTDAACTVTFDALKKVITTPTHGYSSVTADVRPNQTELSEIIYTGGMNGSIFLKVNGQWKRSQVTPAAMLQLEDQDIRRSKSSCRYLRDEVVNGEPAGIYAMHSDLGGGSKDTTVWVSKSRGLPLKETMDLDVGGNGKTHTSSRFEYSNVRPPDGVK